jgi:hypothetical protein
MNLCDFAKKRFTVMTGRYTNVSMDRVSAFGCQATMLHPFLEFSAGVAEEYVRVS